MLCDTLDPWVSDQSSKRLQLQCRRGRRTYRELADGDEVEADVLAGLEVAGQPLDVGLGDAAQHAGVVHHVRVHGGPVVQHVELRRHRRRGRRGQADGERQRGRRQAVVQERHPAPADDVDAAVSIGGGGGGSDGGAGGLWPPERAGDDDGGPGRDASGQRRSPRATE